MTKFVICDDKGIYSVIEAYNPYQAIKRAEEQGRTVEYIFDMEDEYLADL